MADLQQCSTGSLRVCPANAPWYDAQTPSCEASLFFQTTGESNLCKRSLLLNYKTPTLRKHGTAWVYHFLNKQQVTIHCPYGTGWVTHEKILLKGGFICNAITCSITSKEIRTLPELRQTDYTRLDTPAWYVPDLIPALAPNELPQRKEDLPAAVKDLDDIKSCLATLLRSLDVDTLFQIRHTTLQQGHQTHWHLIVTTTSCALVIILIRGSSLRSQLHRLFHRSPVNNPSESKTGTPGFPSNPHARVCHRRHKERPAP